MAEHGNHGSTDEPKVGDSAVIDQTQVMEGRGLKRHRITVDLAPEIYESIMHAIKSRGMTMADAVRKGLAIVQMFDASNYELILRPKDARQPDKIIHLV